MGIYFKQPKQVPHTIATFEADRTAESLIRLPIPETLYRNRIVRFKHLAKDHPMSEFLHFCLKMTELQHTLICQPHPPIQLKSQHLHTALPLYWDHYSLSHHWQDHLTFIVHEMSKYPACIENTCDRLNRMSPIERQRCAEHLLRGEFNRIDPRQALFIWSALSSFYIQLAAQLPLMATADNDDDRQFCPVCGSYPVASILPHSQRQLRYLHCSLCETEWHTVRLKCTNCNDLSQLRFYSLDHTLASIKTECCSHCSGYLKIFYSEHDPELDIVADDLASLLLDEEMEKIGFNKTGLNPYLFN